MDARSLPEQLLKLFSRRQADDHNPGGHYPDGRKFYQSRSSLQRFIHYVRQEPAQHQRKDKNEYRPDV